MAVPPPTRKRGAPSISAAKASARITSYNVCYTKLLRITVDPIRNAVDDEYGYVVTEFEPAG